MRGLSRLIHSGGQQIDNEGNRRVPIRELKTPRFSRGDSGVGLRFHLRADSRLIFVARKEDRKD